MKSNKLLKGNNMHKIFSYTIPHTGTRFMNNILREGVDNLMFIGDLHAKLRGRGGPQLERLPCEGICPSWWQRNVLKYATPEELSSIILFHTHHGIRESEIITSLQTQKPDTKVISSLRNPLLIINTYIWINYSLKGIHLSNESFVKREKRVHDIAHLMENIFSVPSEHIFLFPTDLIQSQSPKEKLSRVQELMNYCEIPMTKKISKLALKWDIVGDTAKTKKLLEKTKGKDFTRFKNIIQSNDINEINKILDIELSCLKKYKTLKYNLEKLGYNICW